MAKYKIQATRTIWYEIEVEAEDEASAFAELDEWIADDFDGFEINAMWEFDIIEED